MAENTWTKERVERLTELHDEGLPTSEIGRRMGITKNAVIGKLYRSGMCLPYGDVTPVPPQRDFFESNGSGCLWPYGHPDAADFHFCGVHRLPGKSYCDEHAAVAYTRPHKTLPRVSKYVFGYALK